MPSDIHVYVRFKEQCVFAGEEVNCVITFKNVNDLPEPTTPAAGVRRSSRQGSISQLAAQVPRHGHSARGPPTPRLPSGSGQVGDISPGPGATTSFINAPISSGNSAPRGPGMDKGNHIQRPIHKQQRSVSIISVTSPLVASNPMERISTPPAQRSKSNHMRSSTVEIYSASQRIPTQYQKDATNLQLPNRNGRRSPLSSTATPSSVATSRRSTPDFKFPVESPPTGNSPADANKASSAAQSQTKSAIPNLNHSASERSSGEFYSLSNHSEETLMSEQPSVMSERTQIPSSMMRQHYRMDSRSQQPRKPQAVNLLMGYAQLSASFAVDGSLVDQSQFEEVKRKGFVGGQAGGGVVGVNKTRPTSGFLGNFSFNSIGESLSNLVGSDSLSSVREMNAVTNSRAIPLLSTPQSLLFVDLHLEPGDEKSYSFSYTLPRGLPSSYRGKSIKVVYNLTVGVQGLPGNKDRHAVRQISVPIRVFPGVSSDGEIYGHDLMQPHVVLRDVARTRSIHPTDIDELSNSSKPISSENAAADFLQFVDGLLDRNRRRQSSAGTMDALFGSSNDPQDRTTVQSINRAILYSNQPPIGSESSPNRFEIVRSGLKVAVVVLDRALHRLGEIVTAIVDFSDCQITTASLHATLETTERVNSSLAVRSAATINRVSRKVYASHSENVLFSRRAVFSPSIPASASPMFVTSGINLDWSLRLEFGTVKPVEQEDGEVKHVLELLEEVINDERGVVTVAVENLDCESFEVIIPLTVYGDKVPDGKESEEVIGIPL